MGNLTNQEKGILYNDMLMRYQKLSEQARHIRSSGIDLSPSDQKLVDEIEAKMKTWDILKRED